MDGLTPNDRATLLELFRRGPRTQQQLADHLGITQQSASRILARLTDAGLTRPGARTGVGARGYPTATFELVPEAACGLGIAVAPGGLTLVIADFTGAILAEERLPLLSPDRVTTFDRVRALAPELVARAGMAWSSVSGVGIAVSGSFLADGTFNTPLSLEDWANRDIAAEAAEHLGLPAFADNDGNAAALAEAMLGVGRTVESLAAIYIAAGVGGGVVLDGRPWRGRHGNAGEFAAGLQPGINPFPSLELLRQTLGNQGIAFESVDDMLACYDPDWPGVDDWIVRVRDSLSIIVSNIAGILDVEAIVLGGRIPKSLAERLMAQASFFDQRRRNQPRPVPRIATSPIESDAASLGAAILPIRAKFHG
jgi:predicted NBD/HSP70 family sugar kinase